VLWSDPEDIEGLEESDRGMGIFFGSDVTENFLKVNNLQFLIRSHEMVDEGYE
jgi:serine/threonine-protein phosphatase 5